MRTQFVRYISHRFPFDTAKAGDVGHDLYVDILGTKQTKLDRAVSRMLRQRVVVIWPFQHKMLASGVFLSMPDGCWAKIRSRSSAAKKNLSVLGGVIDSGYRGELFAVMSNLGLIPRLVRDRERYAQVVFHISTRPHLTHVGYFIEEDATERGATGFGSSGR